MDHPLENKNGGDWCKHETPPVLPGMAGNCPRSFFLQTSPTSATIQNKQKMGQAIASAEYLKIFSLRTQHIFLSFKVGHVACDTDFSLGLSR